MKTQVRTSHIVVINERSKDSQCRKTIPVTFLKPFARLYGDERVKVLVHPGCISTSLASATRDERKVACFCCCRPRTGKLATSTAGSPSSPRLRLSRNHPSAAHQYPHHFSVALSRLPPLTSRAHAHRPPGTSTSQYDASQIPVRCQSIYALPVSAAVPDRASRERFIEVRKDVELPVKPKKTLDSSG